MANWFNNDGLLVKFGVDEATVGNGGEYNFNAEHMVEFDLDLTTVPAVGTPLIVSDTVTIPNGSVVTKVEVLVKEVSVGATANLDLGLIDQDRATAIDLNGLVAAGDDWNGAAVGTTTTYTVGSVEAGALLGTVLTNTGYVTANYDTAAFTDGTLRVRIFHYVP